MNMQWFSKEEFSIVKRHIDAGEPAGIKAWYWENYKGAATTLTLAFVYAVMNGKNQACISRLKALLNPQGKRGPAAWSDVVTEIMNHDSVKAIKTMEILVDNDIDFEIKNGDTIREIVTNPKFKKVSEYIENHPVRISNRLTKVEAEKALSTMLASSSYEIVKKALEPFAYAASDENIKTNYATYSNNKATQKKSVTTTDLLRKTALIKNDAHRVKYIKEEVFGSTTAYVEDLFGEIYKIVKSTTMSGKDVVKVLDGLSPSNKGTYSATKLLHELHQRDEKEEVKEIAKNWPGRIWDGVLDDIRYYSNGQKLPNPELNTGWLIDYYDLIGLEPLVKLLSKIDKDTDDFARSILQKFPDDAIKSMVAICEEKIPTELRDIFIF